MGVVILGQGPGQKGPLVVAGGIRGNIGKSLGGKVRIVEFFPEIANGHIEVQGGVVVDQFGVEHVGLRIVHGRKIVERSGRTREFEIAVNVAVCIYQIQIQKVRNQCQLETTAEGVHQVLALRSPVKIRRPAILPGTLLVLINFVGVEKVQRQPVTQCVIRIE